MNINGGNRMSRFEVLLGTTISAIQKPDVSGNVVHIPTQSGKPVLLTFFRFATCPFCNLRLRTLQTFANEHPEIEIVGVFGSPRDEVKKAIPLHSLTYSLLADEGGELYRMFGIRKSLWGMLKGMIGRMPLLLKAMIKDHLFPKAMHGHLLTMPAEFIISPEGEVLFSHYGSDEGDHASLAAILNVIKKSV